MIRRAIISVSDKTGIVELATRLARRGIEIISTGGTAARLKEAGLKVIAIDDVTGYPECLDGRVKTLHPKIHGGVLAMRSNQEHMATLQQLDIEPIDLVIINLYPFRQTVARPDASREECIENIDIGGPTLLRAAAKNYQDVTVVIDPRDYDTVLQEIETEGGTTLETRFRLAARVFEHTAAYDALIASYLAAQQPNKILPEHLTLTYDLVGGLRYGENPHQPATYYREPLVVPGTLPQAEQLGGKEMSYNNLADTDAALALLKEFTEPTVVAVKHANPCGVGSDSDLITAWQKAYDADSVSIFGGIVAMNRVVDLEVARATKGVFLEVFVAPDYTDDALDELKTRKNLRLLRLPDAGIPLPATRSAYKPIMGGLLVQGQDDKLVDDEKMTVVTEKKPDESVKEDLIFAMKVCKHVKSNAIVMARNKQTVGIGPGQPNRITSVEIAARNAGEKAKGAIMASDAFFPFVDCVEAAAKVGIAAIIQPGGSIRDQESVDACNRLNLPMLFTGIRHFRH